jgi:hypothetical protein
MNNDKKEKNKIIDWIVKIILIIIIIILLIHNCVLIKNRRLKQEPTGNVDIIEITCNKDDVCKKDPEKQNNDNTKPVSGDVEEPETGLIVKDKQITWKGETQAKIFTNSMYKFKDVIAPESSNTYQFIVKNATEYNLKYKIDFVEENPYNVNMKFKLKKNDTYIIDEYVSASELNISDMLLNVKENDTYYLEWKWISSSNDTEVGEIAANYGLKIDIKAESVDE